MFEFPLLRQIIQISGILCQKLQNVFADASMVHELRDLRNDAFWRPHANEAFEVGVDTAKNMPFILL